MMKALGIMIFSLMSFSSAFAQQADLVMTIGGDVNFTKHLQLPEATGVKLNSKIVPFADLTRGLVPIIQGADVNFANIETVITDEALSPVEKAFNFQSHPAGLQHLIDIGYNLFSLANNHSHDYGRRGVEQTLFFMRQFERNRGVGHSGLGENIEAAVTPNIFTIRGIRIGFLAFGNNGFYPTASDAGVLSYNKEEHIQTALRKLKDADVDLRIISIHTGTERKVDLDSGQQAKFRRMLELGNVNLIIGHHPHVVRPIENVNGRWIFYSLGNYLMTGSANITGNGVAQDYGLMGKIFFRRNQESGRLDIGAVQAIPVTNTHAYVRQLPADEARKRVEFLNQLSRKNLNESAVEFQIHEPTGTGQWTR